MLTPLFLVGELAWFLLCTSLVTHLGLSLLGSDIEM